MDTYGLNKQKVIESIKTDEKEVNAALHRLYATIKGIKYGSADAIRQMQHTDAHEIASQLGAIADDLTPLEQSLGKTAPRLDKQQMTEQTADLLSAAYGVNYTLESVKGYIDNNPHGNRHQDAKTRLAEVFDKGGTLADNLSIIERRYENLHKRKSQLQTLQRKIETQTEREKFTPEKQIELETKDKEKRIKTHLGMDL